MGVLNLAIWEIDNLKVRGSFSTFLFEDVDKKILQIISPWLLPIP